MILVTRQGHVGRDKTIEKKLNNSAKASTLSGLVKTRGRLFYERLKI